MRDLVAYYRCYAPPANATSPRRTAEPAPAYPLEALHPDALLVVDVETTITIPQRLLVGGFRLCRVVWTVEDGREVPRVDTLQEGLIVPDDLAEWDAAGHHVVCDYAAVHPLGDVDRDPVRYDAAWPPRPTLDVYTKRAFLDEILWPACYQGHAHLVGFGLPTVLGMLAIRARPSRDRKAFNLHFYGRCKDGKWKRHPNRPPLRVEHIDSTKSFYSPAGAELGGAITDNIAWITAAGAPRFFRGHVLDEHTHSYSLTGEDHTLDSACTAFNVAYHKPRAEPGRLTPELIDGARAAVGAIAGLCRATLGEHARHPIALPPSQAYSPASLAKAYLKAIGITPPSQRLLEAPSGPSWEQVYGAAMTSFYGGRSECHIRRVPVPITLYDVTSTYPTLHALLQLDEYLTAATLTTTHVDAAAVTALVESLTVERLLDPAVWPELRVLCRVEPRPGDVLPVRGRYSGTGITIGLNRIAEAPGFSTWYALPDLVASRILTGQTPRIIDALVVTGEGTITDLRPVRLRGEAKVTPKRLFTGAVEHRKRLPAADQTRGTGLFCKTFAVSGTYGIHAELNPRPEPGEEVVHVYGAIDFDAAVDQVEEPGRYFFPPAATYITAAARLVLAMLEHLVGRAGGSYALCDTDSIAILTDTTGHRLTIPGAAAGGRPVMQPARALRHEQADALVHKLDSLIPYDRALVPHLLQKESQADVFAVSAKRYAPHHPTDGDIELDEQKAPSEHGLGHLLDPRPPDQRDRRSLSEAIWLEILKEEGGYPVQPARWKRLPAVTPITNSTPTIANAFQLYNQNKPYEQQIKPFSHLIASYPDPLYERKADLRLVAPHTDDPREWSRLAWHDLETGESYRITTNADGDRHAVLVRSYADVIKDHAAHPEFKRVGPDGRQCGHQTRGILDRADLRIVDHRHLGKESLHHEERLAGLAPEEGEYQQILETPGQQAAIRTVSQQVARLLGVSRVAKAAGASRDTVSRYLDGHHTRRDRRIGESVVELARKELGHASLALEPLTVLDQYIQRIGEPPHPDSDETLARLATVAPAEILACAQRLGEPISERTLRNAQHRRAITTRTSRILRRVADAINDANDPTPAERTFGEDS